MAVKRSRIEQAEHGRVQAERVQAMITHLRALLAGRMTRAEVVAWARELWPPGRGEEGPFSWGAAASVFDSLWSLEERRGDAALVRDVDLRGYLRWLGEGECFVGGDDPLVAIAGDIEAFAAERGTAAIRWWWSGLGWASEVRFCAPASGRPLAAYAMLDRPSTLIFHTRREDDGHDALVDLFEALAIDDADTIGVDPAIELSCLPAWALWREDDNCNRLEIARCRSYAKACAQQRIFTARGHRQTYWVDPA